MYFQKNLPGLFIYIHFDATVAARSLRKHLLSQLKFRDSVTLKNPYWDSHTEKWVEDDGYGDMPF